MGTSGVREREGERGKGARGRAGRTVTATEAGRGDGDLDLALLWGPESAVLDAEVLWAVEDDGAVGAEGDGGHGELVAEGGVVRCG